MKQFKRLAMVLLFGLTLTANAHVVEKSFFSWLFGHHHHHHHHHDQATDGANRPN